MLHYYVQLGWKAEDFISLDMMQKVFYRASMQVALEDRRQMFDIGRR